MRKVIIFIVGMVVVGCTLVCSHVSAQNMIGGEQNAPNRGVYEISLKASKLSVNPYAEQLLKVTFTRPDSSRVTVDGFYDGDNIFKARAYCDMTGEWKWRSISENESLNEQTGLFRVVKSNLPGKLRIHPKDPRQFAYDNGEWFLHIGDTGYRYVTATEKKWKAYVDQAARMGITKIRTWFCQGRSDVQILFTDGRRALNLDYWQEIDRRLVYALEKHPRIQFQLIPYGEDSEELNRYIEGERMARLVARYAQARFSALPNIHWCISNDRQIIEKGTRQTKGRQIFAATIDRIAEDMKTREPWGTLITNHQSRRSGYSFVDTSWSDIITLEDLDQVGGGVILEYRDKGKAPVINDEDRYEKYRAPKHPRYFFRRLMWASLLSGGHATYGGFCTFRPYDGKDNGIQGYFDAMQAGKLEGGNDFVHIHKFFKDSGLTLVNMTPDDSFVGDNPMRFKCIRDNSACVIYCANPDNTSAEAANASKDVPTVAMKLSGGSFRVKWFNPSTGDWSQEKTIESGKQTLSAPARCDWILLLVVGRCP